MKQVNVPGVGLVQFPDSMSNDQIAGAIKENILPKYGPKPPAPEPMGPWEAGWEQSLGAMDTGIARLLYGMDMDEQAMRYEESATERKEEVAERFQPDVSSYTDIEGVGDVPEYLWNLLGQSGTETGLGLGGALLASTGAGILRGAPLGPVGMAASGIAGAGMALVPSFFGRNIERQAEVQDIPIKDTDAVKAAMTALPQATLDAVLDTFIVGKVLPTGVVRRILQQEGRKGLRKYAGRFIANAIKGSAIEGTTETTQQLLERVQAGNWEGFTPELQKELAEAAVGGMALGGLLGGGAGVIAPEPTPQVNIEPEEEEARKYEQQRNMGLASIAKQGIVNTDQGVVQPAPTEPAAAPLGLPAPPQQTAEYPTKPPRRRNFKQPSETEKAQEAARRRTAETLQAAKEVSMPVAAEPITTFPEPVQQAIRKRRVDLGLTDNVDDDVTVDEIRDVYGDEAAQEFVKAQKPLTQGTGAVPQQQVEETIDLPPTIQVDDVTYDVAQRAVQNEGKVDFDTVKTALEAKSASPVEDRTVQQALAAMVLRGLVTDRTGRVQRAAQEGRDVAEAVARGQGLRPSDTLGNERKPTELPPGTQRRFQVETRPVETRDGGNWTFEIDGAPARQTYPTKKEANEAAKEVKQRRQLEGKPRLFKAREDVVVTEEALDDQGNVVGNIVRRAYTPKDQAQVAALGEVLGGRREGFKSPQEAREVINSVMPIEGMNRGTEAQARAEQTASDYRARTEKLLASLRRSLDEMGLGDVGVRLQNVILTPEGGVAEGLADPTSTGTIITLATDIIAGDPETQLRKVMNHEVIHALRDLGVLTREEFAILVDAANRVEMRPGVTFMQWAAGVYSGQEGFTQEDVAEEAVAEMFREWAADKNNVKGAPQGIFRKIVNFMRRVGNWMRGAGYQSVDDVFRAIQGGEVGGRARGSGETRGNSLRYALRDAGRQRMRGTSTVGFRQDPLRLSGGMPTVGEIARYLDQLVPTRELTNAKSRAAAVRGLTEEMKYQMSRARSGEDWYDADVEKTFVELSKVFPEFMHSDMATRNLARQAFTLIAAPMSNGTKAGINIENAGVAWGYMKKYGHLPGKNPYTRKGWGGTRSNIIEQHLGLINQMMVSAEFSEGNPVQNVMDWMFSLHTGREIGEMRKKFGFKGAAKDARMNEQYPGAYIFGPKIGAFFMNLNGLQDETVDKWAARSIYRHFGQLADAKDKEGIKGGVKTRADREVMKSILRDVAANLGVESRSLQAMLWFYEKDLYNTFGTTIPLETFSNGAAKFIKRYGDLFPAEQSGPRRTDPQAGLAEGQSDTSRPGGVQEDVRLTRPSDLAEETVDDTKYPIGDFRGKAIPKNILGKTPSGRYAIRQRKPNQRAIQLAENYRENAGITKPRLEGKAKPPTEVMKWFADAMDRMSHTPDDPETQASYAALQEAIIDQYELMGDVQVEPWYGEGEPYKNSGEMMDDLENNDHLYFFLTDNGYGEGDNNLNHPMLKDSGYFTTDGKPLLVNDIFRIVHDYYGHAQNATQFGPIGEFNAFLEHAQMLPDEAVPALAAETLLQNAWVNYGAHLRDRDGALPSQGDPNYIPPAQRPYSDQKAFAAPKSVIQRAMSFKPGPKARFSRRQQVENIPAMRYFAGPGVEGQIDETFRPKSRTTLVLMHPDEFIAMSTPGRRNPGQEDVYAEQIDRGLGLDDIPSLTIKGGTDAGEAKVIGHNGRHRAHALSRLGVAHMPVRITHEPDGKEVRWGETPVSVRPATMRGQSGNDSNVMTLPDSVPFPYDMMDLPQAGEPDRRFVSGLAFSEAKLENEQRIQAQQWEQQKGNPFPADKVSIFNREIAPEFMRYPASVAEVAGARVYNAEAVGMYAGMDKLETSTSFTTVWPPEADQSAINNVAAEVFKVAKLHGQKDAFVAEDMGQDFSGPTARPGLQVFFRPVGSGYSGRNPQQVQQIIQALMNDVIGGFTAYRATVNSGAQGYEGLVFIWMPEYSGITNEELDTNFDDVTRKFIEISEYVEQEGIGSTRTSMYKAVLGQRGNYDQIIEELVHAEDAGQRGKAGPWDKPVGARDEEGPGRKGQPGQRKPRNSQRNPKGLKRQIKPRFSLKSRGTTMSYNISSVTQRDMSKGRFDLMVMASALDERYNDPRWLDWPDTFKNKELVTDFQGRMNSANNSLAGKFDATISPDGKVAYVHYVEVYDKQRWTDLLEASPDLRVRKIYGEPFLVVQVEGKNPWTGEREVVEKEIETLDQDGARQMKSFLRDERSAPISPTEALRVEWAVPALDLHSSGIPGFADILGPSDWVAFTKSLKDVVPALEYVVGERASGAKMASETASPYITLPVGRLEAEGNYELKEGYEGQFGPRYSRRASTVPVNNEATIRKIVGQEVKPSPLRAFANMMFGVAQGESIKDALLRNSFNAFAPAYNIDKMLNDGSVPMNHTSVGRGLEMAMQTSGRMQGLLELGPITYNKETGELHFKRDIGGLYDVFERIGQKDKDYFQSYAVAMRELALRKAGRPGFFNLSTEELVSLRDNAPEHFKEVYDEYQKFNDAMVDLAVDTGLMEREKAEELKTLFYTPFYRMMEDDLMQAPAYVLGPKMQAAINNPKSALDVELKGGEQGLGDFYENLIRNYQSIMTASLKNTALNRVANAIDKLNDLGMFGIGEQVGKGRKSKPKGDRIMQFRRDGKPIFYDIEDAPLWISIASMAPPQRNAIVEAASKFAAVLRAGVTLSPGFMLANLWRGKISAYVTTDTPLEPGIKTLKGFRDALKEGPSTEAIKAMTGIGGYTYGMGERNFVTEMARRQRRQEGGGYGMIRDWGDRFMSGIKALENVGEATEMAERVALYDHLVKRGVDEKDAAFEAMNLVNFGRRGAGQGILGATLTALIPMVPFLNARLQGLYRIVENQKGQRRVIGIPLQVFTRGLVITAASSAIYSMFSDDDRWADEPIDRKINYDIMYFGDKTVYLPRAFEVGSLFASLPVLFYDAIRQQDGGDLAKGTASMVFNTFAINPIPQMALPSIEVLTNFNIFTMAPVESLAESRMLPSDRVDDRTSGIARYIGGYTGRLKEETGVGLSPIQVDHLISGYLGTMGTTLLALTDSLLGAAGVIPAKPTGLFGDPFSPAGLAGSALNIDRFVRTDEQRPSKFIRDFYQLRAEADMAYASFKEATLRGDMERAQEVLEAKRAPLAIRKVVGRIGRQIADINRAMRMIRFNPKMSSQEKTKRLKPLIETKRRLAEQGATLGARLGL